MAKKLTYSDELVNACVEYCNSVEPFASNPAYSIEHRVNKGRMAFPIPGDLQQKYINCLSDKFLSNFDNSKIRIIVKEKHEHLFSCLYPVDGVTQGVFKHRDPIAKNGWEHLRINTLLQLAESGGEPIIDNKQIPAKEKEVWSLWANKSLHSAMPISGNKRRILLSLGFHVEPTYVPEVKKLLHDIVDYAT